MLLHLALSPGSPPCTPDPSYLANNGTWLRASDDRDLPLGFPRTAPSVGGVGNWILIFEEISRVELNEVLWLRCKLPLGDRDG